MFNPPMTRRSSPSRQQPLNASPTSRQFFSPPPQISSISGLIVLGRFASKHRVSVEKEKTTVYFSASLFNRDEVARLCLCVQL